MTTIRAPLPPFRSRVLVAVLAALLALLPARRAAAWIDDHDLWYVIEMAGKRAGWMHAAQKTAGDRVTTTSELKLSLLRGKSGMTIDIATTFVETAAGK